MHTHDPATSHRRVALKAPAPVAGAVKAARPPGRSKRALDVAIGH
ncbi:hypothetical protein ACFGUY_004735 [Enterobacter kobei]